jgi:YVTN family beta-propeller protein
MLVMGVGGGQWVEATISLPSSASPSDASLNQRNNCVYVTGCLSDTVYVVDADSLSVIASVPVGQRPVSICCNPDVNRVYSLSSWDRTVTVINGEGHGVLATVEMNRDAHWLFCNRPAQRVYSVGIDIEQPKVAVLDCRTNRVVAGFDVPRWPSAFCASTFDPQSYIAVIESTVVIDGDNPVGMLRSPPQQGAVMCFGTRRNRLYSSDGNGCLDVIDCATDSIVASCSLGAFVTHACYSPVRDLVYFSCWDSCLVVYDCAADSIAARVEAGRTLGFSCLDTIADKLYVISSGNRVEVIDGATNRLVAGFEVGTLPCRIAWSPVSRRMFVVNTGNSVTVIRDTACTGVVETWAGGFPVRPSILVKDVLRSQAGAWQNTEHSAELLDITGRRVMALQPGPNDIRHLAPGIYFVRTAEGGGRSAVRKVVVQK